MSKPALKPALALLALVVLLLATAALADRTTTCSTSGVTVMAARLFRGADAGWAGEVCGFTRAADAGTIRGAEGCAYFEAGPFNNAANAGRDALVAELCP